MRLTPLPAHVLPRIMLRRLYNWTMAQAQTPHALWVLAGVSFIESSVFPIPPDVLIIPMVLAAPHRAWLIAGLATVASVLGGLFGYLIGWAFYESIGLPVLEFYGKTDSFDEFSARYNAWGAWAVLFGGITPLPYKLFTILSGSTGLNIVVFTIASIVARGIRFFIVAGLLWQFGDPIRDFIERRLGLLFLLFMICLLGGFLVLRYL